MPSSAMPLSLNPLKPHSPFSNNSSSFRNSNTGKSKSLLKPISATPFLFPPSSNNNNNNGRRKAPQLIIPTPPTPSNEVYQPFRPPPRPLPPQFQSVDPSAQLDILRNRLGLWFEYAPLISSLLSNGYTPPTIEESTGITGVEQNRLAVATQVRDSLLSSNLDPQIISFFDMNGADLLYELRFLSAPQRALAATRLAESNLDGRAAQEIARAMKDFPRRRGQDGWESFSGRSPGDCVAFMHFRMSREHRNELERVATLEKALAAAETDQAKERIKQEMEKTVEGEKEEEIRVVSVPVVRLKTGEVAEATRVGVFPVVGAGEGEASVIEAPEIWVEGEFGVVVADKGWRKWVVLPCWQPVGTIGKGGFVVKFGDGRVLPWKAKSGYVEEEILVLADRERKEVVEENGFYLVRGGGKDVLNLVVEKGKSLKERGVKEVLGAVVLVVRPPRMEEDDQLADEDWE